MNTETNNLTSQEIAVLSQEWQTLKDRLGIAAVQDDGTFLPSGWLKSQHGSPAQQARQNRLMGKIVRKVRQIVLRVLGYHADYELLIGAIVGIDARLRRIESELSRRE